MTSSSSPHPEPAGSRPEPTGPHPEPPAPAGRRWPQWGLLLLLCALLGACVSGPAAPLPEAAGKPRLAELRVEDERGPLSARRAEAALRRLGRDASEHSLLAHHLAQVEGVVSTPLVLGNDAHLLVDGPKTQDAMFQAIAQAQHHIDLETYILEADGAGERLAELLEERRAKGVEVRVLYDSVGSIATPAAYFERLRAAGVAVCEFNPVNPLRLARDTRLNINNRDHRKILVVDRQVAFTGGINISAVYSSGSFGRKVKTPDPKSGWRDTHVIVRGPVVSQFQNLFDEGWQNQRCQPETPPREAVQAKAPGRAGAMAMRAVAADPASQRSELYVALLSAIDHASKRVWLTYGYFVPDERTLESLVAASRRGVDVRLALPGFSDFWAPFHAGRSHYDTLLEAGIRVFERRDALLHAKTAVIDGVWSSVGSTNLDWRSFVHNYEADVLVLDAGFAREMEALFARDEAASHEILAQEWKRRDVGERFLEWLARRWEYFL
ncbi:cardiolipin synthase B [Azoarcus sp. TTM-91]|nr:cardiolipin synthase B [Azoarcus sp. TTM-91]